MGMFSRLLLAASCVTSLPLAVLHKEAKDLSGLSKYLPAVGLIIAAVLLAAVWILKLVAAGSLLVGVTLTVLWLAISGGIHMDGLMDTADGVFSHKSKERMLEIMHDSRVGNFGVMAGVVVILIKVAALASASGLALFAASALVPVWSRWCETFAIGFFPYAREEGLGKVWHDTTKCPGDIIIAGVLPVLMTVGAGIWLGWQIPVALSLFVVLAGLTAAFQLGAVLQGQTGDTYGAIVELAESGGLLLAALFLPMWRL